ncbi:hypothetical protein ABEB36_006291 [Hypothenemus hampei]|uniref:Threonine aspartase 1 n=1 Tax=Hypothenemus hampei TaxID=57062 RepID=A0ABD1EQ24_HYPHA
MIAVHCGAGHYSTSKRKDYMVLSKRACRKAMNLLEKGGTALEAIQEAIKVLENDPLTNAGYGSNLTLEGLVEADASTMNGENLVFGACGAVRNVKNPICLAYNINQEQLKTLPLGLMPPSVLVGRGALQHAKTAGLTIVKNSKLVSHKASKQRQKYQAMLDAQIENGSLDTVGAVCIDCNGNVASGCSSGGILLKRPGRLGQAAHYGCGVWADSKDKATQPSIAVCTTGCGEYLVKTLLAKTIADDLMIGKNCPVTDLHKCLNEKFINSKLIGDVPVSGKLCGALVLKANQNGEISLLWGHNTTCLGVGYMKFGDKKPRAQISLLPDEASEGKSINVGGTEFCLENVRWTPG